MFTGIVQGIRKITAVVDLEGRRRLRIQLEELSEKLQQGASVAVNGVCLTVVRFEDDWAEFDIIRESLNKSNMSMSLFLTPTLASIKTYVCIIPN